MVFRIIDNPDCMVYIVNYSCPGKLMFLQMYEIILAL